MENLDLGQVLKGALMSGYLHTPEPLAAQGCRLQLGRVFTPDFRSPMRETSGQSYEPSCASCRLYVAEHSC